MKTFNTLTLAAMLGTVALTSAQADEWDKKTIVTINAPVRIPSTTLQPGTYTLKLMDSNSDRHIVTVWDKDGMHLIATVLAIPNYRLRPTGETKITMWETPAGEPAALRAWFYPGANFGQEFAYPKHAAQHISETAHASVPSLAAEDEAKFGGRGSNMSDETMKNSATTQQAEIVPPTAVQPTNETALAAPAAGPTPAPAPSSVSATAPAEETPAPIATAPSTTDQQPATETPTPMPQTATNTHEVLSLGLLLSLTGLSTFLVRSKRT